MNAATDAASLVFGAVFVIVYAIGQIWIARGAKS